MTEVEPKDLRSLIWEARYWHPHPGRANKASYKDKEIGVISWETLADRCGYGTQQDTGYGVTDECRYDLVHKEGYSIRMDQE